MRRDAPPGHVPHPVFSRERPNASRIGTALHGIHEDDVPPAGEEREEVEAGRPGVRQEDPFREVPPCSERRDDRGPKSIIGPEEASEADDVDGDA